jgi:tetratricopeptide (TPR) repeat protein
MGYKSAAIEVWRHGLELDPTADAAGILRVVQSFGLLGELQSYYETESSMKTSPTPSLVYALICERSGSFDKALEARRRLVKLYPGNQQYWISLGDVEKRVDHLDAARQAYARAAKMSDSTLRTIAEERLNWMGR